MKALNNNTFINNLFYHGWQWAKMLSLISVFFNASHQSHSLRFFICYGGNFVDHNTVEIVSVAICVRSCHLEILQAIECLALGLSPSAIVTLGTIRTEDSGAV